MRELRGLARDGGAWWADQQQDACGGRTWRSDPAVAPGTGVRCGACHTAALEGHRLCAGSRVGHGTPGPRVTIGAAPCWIRCCLVLLSCVLCACASPMQMCADRGESAPPGRAVRTTAGMDLRGGALAALVLASLLFAAGASRVAPHHKIQSDGRAREQRAGLTEQAASDLVPELPGWGAVEGFRLFSGCVLGAASARAPAQGWRGLVAPLLGHR